MNGIIILTVEARMAIKNQNDLTDFDAPVVLLSKTRQRHAASTTAAGAIPIEVNGNSKPSVPYQNQPGSDPIHQHNLNVLRRVDGNPTFYNRDLENGMICDSHFDS